MSKFADVLKGAKDLLSKPFVSGQKVEIKTSTDNGIIFTTEAQLAKPTSASVKAEGATGNFKVDKLQIGTDKKITGEFSLVEAFPGTKLTFKATDGSRAAGADAISATIGAEFKHDVGTFTADVDAIGYGVVATGLVSYEGFLAGASVKAGLNKAGGVDVKEYDVVAGYKTKEFTVAAQTDKKFSGVTAAFHQLVSADITAAAVAKFPLAPKATPAAFDVEAGLAYRVAKDTTVTGKVSSAGKVAVSYAQVVSPLTKITFSGEVDAANISSDDHKFGLLLNITH